MESIRIDLSKKKKEFKSSMMLHQGKVFIAVEGEPDLIIQGILHVDRVYKFLEDGGQPVIDPRNKRFVKMKMEQSNL